MNGSGITYEDVILAQSREEEEKLRKKLEAIKFYIEQSDIKDMLWGKEILKIIGDNDDGTRDV